MWLHPWVRRSPGGGHGSPLQYSCLENPMDRGAWWAMVHGVTKSGTRRKRLSIAQHTQHKWQKRPREYSGSVMSPFLASLNMQYFNYHSQLLPARVSEHSWGDLV